MAKLIVDGYGQLELNQVAWPRDGRIEAQCALDPTQFHTGVAEDDGVKPYCENGMILVVDNVNRMIHLPEEEDDELDANAIYAINYSTEHLYDERHQNLKDFKLHAQPTTAQKVGAGRVGRIWPGYDFFPRLGYMSVGDKFTTNTVELGDLSYEDIEENLAKTKYYGGASATGYIAISTTVPTAGPVLQVIKATTMPDGQPALKFQVVKA